MRKRNLHGFYAHEPALNMGCRLEFLNAKLLSVLLAKFSKHFVGRDIERVLLQEASDYKHRV